MAEDAIGPTASRNRLNTAASNGTSASATEGMGVGRSRVPHADLWAYKDPLREKTISHLRDLNQRITTLHAAEIMRYQARRPVLTAPARRHALPLESSESRAKSSIPPGLELSTWDDDAQLPPLERKNYLNVPKVEARRHVARDVDKKAQKVVHEVTREFFDALRSQALTEYDQAIKQRRNLPISQKLANRLERNIENQVLRAVDLEMDRIKSKLPADAQMRQTIMTNARERIRNLTQDYERRFEREAQELRSPAARSLGTAQGGGHDPEWIEDEDYYYYQQQQQQLLEARTNSGTKGNYSSSRRGSVMPRSPGRQGSVQFSESRMHQGPGADDDWTMSGASTSAGPQDLPAAARSVSITKSPSRRSIIESAATDDERGTPLSSRPRRVSGVGQALESLVGMMGFKSMPLFYFFQPDNVADTSNRRASVALARRKSISGQRPLESQPSGTYSLSAVSVSTTVSVARTRRASTLGAQDRQSKLGSLTEVDQDVQEYVKGSYSEMPVLAQFASGIKLCSLDLDRLFTKDKAALVRLDEVVRAASLAESVDVSHNSLGNHWIASVLDTIESVRERIRRVDLSGNALCEPEDEDDDPERSLAPEDIMIPRVPRDLIGRKGAHHHGYHLGDFFYLVDMEEGRRQTMRHFAPVQASQSAQRKSAAVKSGGRDSSASLGVVAEGHMHPAQKSGRGVSFGIHLVRDFLTRMGGIGHSATSMDEVLRSSKSRTAGAEERTFRTSEEAFQPYLETLLLRYNQMSFKALRDLMPGLASVSTLQELDLSQNPFGPHAGETVAELLRACRGLKALALSWCELTADAVFHIANVLTDGHGGEGGVQHPLSALDLSHNPIGPEVTPALHRLALMGNKLIELHMSSCDLTQEVAFGIASGLLNRPENLPSGLRLLNVNSNPIDAEGVNALKMVIRARFQSDKPRMFLFADGHDDQVFVDALARLQRATSVAGGFLSAGGGIEMGNGTPPPAPGVDLRNRLQRRISSVNADSDTGLASGPRRKSRQGSVTMDSEGESRQEAWGSGTGAGVIASAAAVIAARDAAAGGPAGRRQSSLLPSRSPPGRA